MAVYVTRTISSKFKIHSYIHLYILTKCVQLYQTVLYKHYVVAGK